MPDIDLATLNELKLKREYRFIRFNGDNVFQGSKDKKEWHDIDHPGGGTFRIPCHTVMDLASL